MKYDEVIQSGKPFNRKKYRDGWYRLDRRGCICHISDLSQRNPPFSDKDKEANDWHILEFFCDYCGKEYDGRYSTCSAKKCKNEFEKERDKLFKREY